MKLTFPKISIAIFLCVASSSPMFAQGRVLFQSETASLAIKDPRGLDISPKDHAEGTLLIAGTYSRAENYGIDGLAIVDGILKSKTPQSWGGILLINEGKAQIFPTADVALMGESYDLTAANELYTFIEAAKEARVSVIQSHLLIKDGALDLREGKNAPKFVRRILFTTKTGGIGVWQSATALTLFEGTSQLLAEQHPQMAINLDMGAYDYCREWTAEALESCGEPTAGYDVLTNLIELRTSQTAE